MPDIVITDEARQYLEMLSPGISEDFNYRAGSQGRVRGRVRPGPAFLPR
jgi:hypothetical protein